MSPTDFINFSFCQISDLNLDSSAALNLHLSPTQRKQRSEESLEALTSAMKLAVGNKVNAVLVPGNLFDASNITTDAVAQVQRIFATLHDIPVFIAAGALDPIYNDSLYDESALRAHGLEPWSENVHIFQSNSVQTFSLPNKASVKISGIGLTKDASHRTPTIPALAESDKVAINILLLPLGLLDTKNGAFDSKISASIKSLGYSYVAISGFNNAVNLYSSNGNICAAAAGTFIGQTEWELGERLALFGNLNWQPNEVLETTIHPEEFDPRRIVGCIFDVTSKEPSTLKALLKEAIETSNARLGRDILVLHLDGFYPGGTAVDLVSSASKEDFFHLKISDNMRPDYLEKLSDKNLIEAKFVSMMDELRMKAESEVESEVESETESETETVNKQTEETKVIVDALYYGLEAIREGKVTIRHAD